jgi:hypothetical protein
MNAKRTTWAAMTMAMGLSAMAGCAASDPVYIGGAKAPTEAPPAPPPAATYAPSAADAPAAPAPMAQGRDESWRRSKEAEESPRKDRPGLGTEWGETRFSSISRVSFERADFASPFASLALFYNDREGANAMASVNRSWSNSFAVAGGLVTVDLRDEGGRPYQGFASAGRSYVIGEVGHRYSIVLHNRTDFRFEVLLSVDGLDVMDGKSASFDKRGYILDPHGELEVDGFRQSTDTVAAFRFGSVKNSYAEKKHGDSRNVGVIGVALFHERGMPQPVWSAEEIRQRRSANPFPGTFATPPGE